MRFNTATVPVPTLRSIASTRERLAMMEELIEEQEEERDLMIDKFERRERVLKIVLGTAVIVIIALIVLVAVK